MKRIYSEPAIRYDFSVALEGLRVGVFADDFDGEYVEAGYGNTLSVQDVDLVDYNFAVIYSSDDLLGGDDDISFVLTISKSFDVRSSK